MVRGLSLTVLIALTSSLASCSTSFHAKSCRVDDDCGGGLVCAEGDEETTATESASKSSSSSTTSSCVTASSAPLRVGMSAPVTGPSQDLGIEMKKGIGLAFDEQNRAGGIRGRAIELVFRDDEYRPASAEAAARELLDVAPIQTNPPQCPTTSTPVVAGDAPVGQSAMARGRHAVIGLVGSVGTPTMVRSAPIAVETGSLFFGAFTGAAKVLRDGSSGACRRYIFNIRASYAQEARATLEFFLKQHVPDSRHLISFDQNDTFGQAGYDGLVAAYGTLMNQTPPTITRFRYTRDDESSVPAQVDAAAKYMANLLATDSGNHTVGILMTDTYGPAIKFIKGIRDWQYANDAEQSANKKATRLTILFSNLSFVGPNSLAVRLRDAKTVMTPDGPKPYADNVFVSQVVPNYENDQSDAVRDYKKALADAQLAPSFTSLEGYLTGRVFVAGLLRHQGVFTPQALIATFESMPRLSLGLGATAGFGPDDHDYSKSVFGTAITADGGFTNRYYWSAGGSIQLFE